MALSLNCLPVCAIIEIPNHCFQIHFCPSSQYSDYNNKTDLHIALTTSQGIIVEFDKHGLRRHTTRDGLSQWEQSLVVESVPEPWYDHWDDTLAKVSKIPSNNV